MSDEGKNLDLTCYGPEGSSVTIGKLTEALSKAQGELQHAIKDAENPHFRSKFATLAAVIDACRTPLAKHGLAVFQKIEGEIGKLSIITILSHSSGEWMKSTLPLIINKNDMQGLGSAISYGRRYALSAIVGVAQEDDDGNNAGQAQQQKDQKAPQNKNNNKKTDPPRDAKELTLDQQISVGMKKTGWTLDQVNSYVAQAYGVKPGGRLQEEKKKELIVILGRLGPEIAFQDLEQKRKPAKPGPRDPATEVEIEAIYGLCMDRNIPENVLQDLVTRGYGYRLDEMPMWVADEIFDLLQSGADEDRVRTLTSSKFSRREADRIKAEQR